MDDYLSLYRAILRAEQSNKSCDRLSLDSKYIFEKNHEKTSSNIAAIPKFQNLSSFIKTQTLM